jgi:hypothetical protein
MMCPSSLYLEAAFTIYLLDFVSFLIELWVEPTVIVYEAVTDSAPGT